ncbi:Uncharacterized protein HZ326_24687 [Fusarium oxysporum f. sp. albedinis]|nr:Uncharacterized protein HZ326_24687 [Fusarium oxysporum f. sp. albedinis]
MLSGIYSTSWGSSQTAEDESDNPSYTYEQLVSQKRVQSSPTGGRASGSGTQYVAYHEKHLDRLEIYAVGQSYRW